MLDYLVSAKTFAQLAQRFQEYQTITSFAVAISPLPYRTLTITAGFLGIPLFPFIPFSILARGMRFFAIASVMHVWGETLNWTLKNIVTGYFFLSWRFLSVGISAKLLTNR